MSHYKTLLDPSEFVGPQDFPKPKALTISRVVREQLKRSEEGGKTGAPMMYFAHGGAELPRKYKVPNGVMFALSLVHGSDVDAWVGKTVTLFAAKCLSFGDVEECVRPELPPEVERKVLAWYKKRKASPRAYIIKQESGS